VLIFFVYISLAIAGQKALARGAIPSWFGLWWTHAAVIVLAALIVLAPRWRARARYRRNNARRGPAVVVPA
jgi:lipopolysaccharide export LptBFGC system permease protein LptF